MSVAKELPSSPFWPHAVLIACASVSKERVGREHYALWEREREGRWERERECERETGRERLRESECVCVCKYVV